MKVKLLLVLFAVALLSCKSSNQPQTGKLEVTVSYERQEGRGSNQYAVWIEDQAGKLVKTLFVTRFTAEGGYMNRPTCTPMWVEKAKAQDLSKEQIDAFSGATPQTGDHVYTWDLTDDKGTKLPDGEYNFIVQATLWSDNQVIYKGKIKTGGKDEIELTTTPEYSSTESINKRMITEVKGKYYLN